VEDYFSARFTWHFLNANVTQRFYSPVIQLRLLTAEANNHGFTHNKGSAQTFQY